MNTNDYLNSLFGGVSSTTTENETEQQTTYSPQTDYSSSPYSSSYERDDYSSAQNYTEQQTYNPTTSTSFDYSSEQKQVSAMDTPLIEKSTPAVNLIKTQAKIRLETRMKIVLSVFMVIVACLTFISIYNFVEAGRIRSTFADKEIQIKNLEESISSSKGTYTLVSDDEYIRQWAEDNNYVVKNDQNTATIYLEEMYEEPTIQDIPSNWFNDVCEFFSRLFA